MTSKGYHPNMVSIFHDPIKEPTNSKDSIDFGLKPDTPDYSQYFEIDMPIEYVSVVSSFIQDLQYQRSIKDQGFGIVKNKRMMIDLVMLDTFEDKFKIAPTMSLN